MCIHHKICLHSEEANPVLVLPSTRPERLGSAFVSNSLLDNSGFEDDEDPENKRYKLLDEVSFCLSPVSVK